MPIGARKTVCVNHIQLQLKIDKSGLGRFFCNQELWNYETIFIAAL